MKSTEIRESIYQEISPSVARDNNEFGEITGQVRKTTVPCCAAYQILAF